MNEIRSSESGAELRVDNASRGSLFSSDQVLRLLSAIRASSIPKDEKMSLRDAILQYSQSDDEEEKHTLRKQITDGIQPYTKEFSSFFPAEEAIQSKSEVTYKQNTEQNNTLGRNRKQPSFGIARSQTDAQSGTAGISASSFKDEIPRAPQNAVESERPIENSEKKVEDSEDHALENRIPTAKEPTVSNSTEKVFAAPPQHIEEKAPQTSSQAPEVINNEDYKTRITRIKHTVNDRVGNPVNLMEINRGVGQEYMSALLDAMKKTSGGVGGSSTAMKRLEAAFISVMRVLDEAPSSTAPTQQADAQKKKDVAEVQKEETVKNDVEEKEQQEKEGEETVKKEKIELKSEPKATETTATKKNEQEEKNEDVQSVAPRQREEKQIPITRIETTAMHAPDATREEKQLDVTPANPSTTEKETLPSNTPTTKIEQPTESKDGLLSSSIAKSEQKNKNNAPTPLRSLNSVAKSEPILDRTAEATTPTTQSEIAAKANALSDRTPDPEPKVDAGLEQLLSEWKLFSRSGFFGTGPHGSEHPLYKRLAKLPMAAVIAGRFEGSTPEVKQSITDYMNGWRYEQGIVHKMEEHFEQYLKRVIRHILETSKYKVDS